VALVAYLTSTSSALPCQYITRTDPLDKAAVQCYLDAVRQQVRFQVKIKAKFRAWGIIVTDTQRVYHPRHRAVYLNRLTRPAIRAQLQSLYDLFDAARKAKRSAFRQMIALGKRYPEIARFRQVPGCGVVSAHVFSAWVQTPHRFARKQQLWRYAQLVIRDRSSDGKPLGFKRLDREGNGVLKQVSYWICLGALRRSGANGLKAYYQASLERTHDKTHARLNTQRKALAILLAMWKHKEDYHDDTQTAVTDSPAQTHAAVPGVTGL
jgi:transposase